MLKRTFEGWTDHNHEIAVRMWARDKSATEIGAYLGASRNSVLGYMNRHRDEFPKKTEPVVDAPKDEGKGDTLRWFRWTKDNIDLAVKMYADGNSKSVIASAVGCSIHTAEKFFKNNRDIFPLRGYIPSSRPSPLKVPQTIKAPEVVETFVGDPTKWKTLENLNNCDCRWIMEGAGLGAMFCAEETAPGSSWCSYHRRKAYAPRIAA